jgi:hypothetical protein
VLTDGITTGRLQLSGWFLAEDRDTPYEGSDKTPNPLEERTRVRVWLLTGDLRLTQAFGVQVTATVPDVTRSAVVERPTSTVDFSETFYGTGDTSVIAWRRYATFGWNLTVNGGVSLPTGKTERPRFRTELDDGSLVPTSRLQRGTGTFDPIVGMSMNKLIGQIFPPGLRVFVSGAARAPLAENEFGLRTGASWEIGAGASREVKWHPLIAIGRISWLHRERDVFERTPVLVGGGNWLYVAPAVALALGKVTIQAELKVPVYRDLANRQLDAARSVQVGVVWQPF